MRYVLDKSCTTAQNKQMFTELPHMRRVRFAGPTSTPIRVTERNIHPSRSCTAQHTFAWSTNTSSTPWSRGIFPQAPQRLHHLSLAVKNLSVSYQLRSEQLQILQAAITSITCRWCGDTTLWICLGTPVDNGCIHRLLTHSPWCACRGQHARRTCCNPSSGTVSVYRG